LKFVRLLKPLSDMAASTFTPFTPSAMSEAACLRRA
jgi:hypothetical protein